MVPQQPKLAKISTTVSVLKAKQSREVIASFWEEHWYYWKGEGRMWSRNGGDETAMALI